MALFNMRRPGSRFLKNEIICNPYIRGALALCCGLLLIAVYLPSLSAVLSLTDPGRKGRMVIIGLSLTPLIVGQILKSKTFHKGDEDKED
jgi:Ca2+-transporting ATPase